MACSSCARCTPRSVNCARVVTIASAFAQRRPWKRHRCHNRVWWASGIVRTSWRCPGAIGGRYRGREAESNPMPARREKAIGRFPVARSWPARPRCRRNGSPDPVCLRPPSTQIAAKCRSLQQDCRNPPVRSAPQLCEGGRCQEGRGAAVAHCRLHLVCRASQFPAKQ